MSRVSVPTTFRQQEAAVPTWSLGGEVGGGRFLPRVSVRQQEKGVDSRKIRIGEVGLDWLGSVFVRSLGDVCDVTGE